MDTGPDRPGARRKAREIEQGTRAAAVAAVRATVAVGQQERRVVVVRGGGSLIDVGVGARSEHGGARASANRSRRPSRSWRRFPRLPARLVGPDVELAATRPPGTGEVAGWRVGRGGGIDGRRAGLQMEVVRTEVDEQRVARLVRAARREAEDAAVPDVVVLHQAAT